MHQLSYKKNLGMVIVWLQKHTGGQLQELKNTVIFSNKSSKSRIREPVGGIE